MRRTDIEKIKSSRICANSYLPEELPPCFTSAHLGKWVGKLKSSHISSLLKQKRERFQVEQIDTYGARFGGLLRRYSLPSPDAFIKLALEIERSRHELIDHFSRSDISASKPTTSHKYRALGLTYRFKDLLDLKRRYGKRDRWLLKADISHCFPSIYTHSISWALHGRVEAKQARRSWALFGNRLDQYVMDGQGGETRGIPVGPDTSRVVSEIVLSAVDKQLELIRGFRFMDDYWLFCESREQAEHLLGELQIELMKYRLNINSSKTIIKQHENVFEDDWVGFLKRNIPKNLKSPADFDKCRSLISDCLNRYPKTPAVKYLFSAIRNKHQFSKLDEALVRLLMDCVDRELALIPDLIRFLAHSVRDGGFNGVAFEQFECWIPKCIRLGYHIELAWILWYALECKVKLSQEQLEACSRVESNFVSLLIMILIEKELCEHFGLQILDEVEKLHDDPYYKGNWLFRYECALKGWLDPEPLKSLGLNDLYDSELSFLREDIGNRKWYVPVSDFYE